MNIIKIRYPLGKVDKQGETLYRRDFNLDRLDKNPVVTQNRHGISNVVGTIINKVITDDYIEFEIKLLNDIFAVGIGGITNRETLKTVNTVGELAWFDVYEITLRPVDEAVYHLEDAR